MRILLLVCAMALAACNGPLCEDVALENDFTTTCAQSASLTECSCAWEYLADRHTCSEFTTAPGIPASSLADAEAACD